MLLSREELDRSAQPDPQVAAYLAKNPPPPSDRQRDPLITRAAVDAYSTAALARLGDPPSNQTESYHEIEMRDGYKSVLKINKPANGTAVPLIVLIFGGGYVAGNVDQLTEPARALAQLFGATVVSISYRLAPEHKFPVAQLDAWDSIKWIAANATGSLLHADPSRGFIIGGVSAGGGIAGALSRKFQEAPLAHPLTGQWLCIPSLINADSVPEKYCDRHISNEQNQYAPGLDAKSSDMMREAAQWDVTSDLRYAANSTTRIADQPRTYFQIDGMDPLRDDGLVYDEMLKSAGVNTKVDFYSGCPHGHWFEMVGYEIGDRARIDTIVGFGWLLEKPVSRGDVATVLGISTQEA